MSCSRTVIKIAMKSEPFGDEYDHWASLGQFDRLSHNVDGAHKCSTEMVVILNIATNLITVLAQ